MLVIGSHLSCSKGFLHMGEQAKSIGANTFQFFTRNPRGGKAKAIDLGDTRDLIGFMEKNNFPVILAHAPYTLNACAKDERTREFALETMRDDLNRMEYLPGNYYNMHPGSHVGQGMDVGVQKIADTLNATMQQGQTTTILLETMAGKGTEVGGNFSELSAIIEKVHLNDKVGVCLDTCHIFDGGYDIVNNLEEVLRDFDATIGLERLKAIHLNDSVHGYLSHKDRHAKIGEGCLGIEACVRIINHPQLRHLPFFLETPNELDGYQKEISLLRELYTNE